MADIMKTIALLAVSLLGIVAGCSTPSSWSHMGTTHVSVTGTAGVVVTGFYLQGGHRIALSNTVPWRIAVPRLSSLELRTIRSNEVALVDLRYHSLTAHAHITTKIDSANGTRIAVKRGFSVNTVP